MRTRYIIVIMIVGMLFITTGLLGFIYVLVYTPTLWGVRLPIIYLGFFAAGSGAGVTAFITGAWAGIIQTKNRIKKKIERHKTLSVIRKTKAV